MRIVHVVYGMGMGGIETMLVNISNWQVACGHQVHIVVINDIVDYSLIDLLDKNIKVWFLGRKKGSKNPLPVIMLNYRLVRLSPDVIHIHTSSISKYIVPGHLKRRMCATLHGLCLQVNINNIEHAGQVFSISQGVHDDLIAAKGVESIVVYNGIKTDDVARVIEPKQLSNPFRIVEVGRLNHELKGQHILIEAIRLLRDRGLDVCLTLIGDGPSRDYLEKLVRQHRLESHIEFLGNCSQSFVHRCLNEYDLFVQPSLFEGFGLTVAEAMAAGVPVLVSDLAGPMEIINSGQYGFHFKRGDAADCARAIEQIINNYPGVSFRQAAAEWIDRNFDVRVTAERYLKLYEGISGCR